MTHISRTRFALALMAVLAFASIGLRTASAQVDWPAGRAITYVVPYPAGGTLDILARAIAPRLGIALKTTVIVDNRAGATGTIGGAYVARAQPDGLTFIGTSIGPQAILPHLMKLPYDPVKSYEPVSLTSTAPHVLVVNPKDPYTSVQQLVAAAKAKPGMTFASGGNGTILHLQGELLRVDTGADFTHVPYKGDIPALQDVVAGQVQFAFLPASVALQQIQSGRLRAMAVTSAQRLPALPAVPTMVESGFKDFVVEQWQAIYVPAKTPAAIVNRLHDEIARILAEPDVVATFEKSGLTVVNGTPAQLKKRQAEDLARWGAVVKAANVKMD